MKNHRTFKIIALITFLSISLSFLSHTSISALDSFPDTSGVRQAYLYNIENDIVVFSKGSETSHIAPASTVKIMSGLLAIKHLKERQDEYVNITYDMLRDVEGFAVNFKVGDKVKIKDLLYGLICGGGNDAAMILAHICSGDIGSFVEEMNNEASALGMLGTKYQNPTGIDTQGMTTTLSDTVLLSKKTIENPLFVEIASTSEYQYTVLNTGEVRTIANRNALISSFSAMGYKNKYVKGLNSGMTDNGGYCVSAYASNGQDSYLCVVMGGNETTNGRITSYTVANELLNYVFNNYSYTKIASKGDIMGNIAVELALPTNGNQSVTVDCILENDVYAYAPKNIYYKRDLTYKTYFHSKILTAPIKKGTLIGGVEIFYQDKLLAREKLVISEDVTESQLLVLLNAMKKAILSRTTLIFIIVLTVSLSIYFYITVWRKKIKRRKRLSREMNKK